MSPWGDIFTDQLRDDICLSRSPRSGTRSRSAFDRDPVALSLKRGNGATRDPLGMATVVVIGAGLVVFELAGEDGRWSPGAHVPPPPPPSCGLGGPGCGDSVRRRHCLVCAWRPGASIRAVRSQPLPFRVRPDLRFPALSLLPGHRPAQLAR
jgi:hypothetical protein